MNYIGDLECEYHSNEGLIEKMTVLSVCDGDCVIRILRDNRVIRTPYANIQFLTKQHEMIEDVTTLKINEDLLLTKNEFSSFVSVINVNDNNTVDVMMKSNILVDGEQILSTPVENLRICGQYVGLGELKTIDIMMDREYSRYFNNISIFKQLVSHIQNIVIIWNAVNSTICVKAIEESSLKKVQLLMPVFVHQLGVLLTRDIMEKMYPLAKHIVWEYQYMDEEEANFAIGSKGAHIVAVRNIPGIAGAVLTRTNRLRIIAESKSALNAARALLEIKRESYPFEESVVPMLIGKGASHISELINKTGLHCVHLPHLPSNGVVRENPLIVSPSLLGRRELFLFGTRESIASAKLLLEMEESVKEIRRQYESQKLRQNSSLVSSTSSVSKEGDGEAEGDGRPEEAAIATGGAPIEDSAVAVEDEDDDNSRHGNGGGGQLKRTGKAPMFVGGGGGLVFTNSGLGTDQIAKGQSRPPRNGRQGGWQPGNYYRGPRSTNNNNNNSSSNHSNNNNHSRTTVSNDDSGSGKRSVSNQGHNH